MGDTLTKSRPGIPVQWFLPSTSLLLAYSSRLAGRQPRVFPITEPRFIILDRHDPSLRAHQPQEENPFKEVTSVAWVLRTLDAVHTHSRFKLLEKNFLTAETPGTRQGSYDKYSSLPNSHGKTPWCMTALNLEGASPINPNRAQTALNSTDHHLKGPERRTDCHCVMRRCDNTNNSSPTGVPPTGLPGPSDRVIGIQQIPDKAAR